MPGLVGVLVTLGMVVVAPLGLRRLRTPGPSTLLAWWPALGLLAAGGLLLPRGVPAVWAVTPYTVACLVVGVCGALRLARWLSGPRTGLLPELVALTAALSLPVAAAALVSERAGYELLGFSLPVLGLTVAHFHFAGFAAVLLAGCVAQASPGRASSSGAVAVPVGTAVVAAGHFTGRSTELVGTVLLAAGLLATSWVAARHLAPGLNDAPSRRLLLVASWTSPLTMALAVWFALGRATGLPHLSIADTALTHGVANALGVGLCGLLAWTRVAPRPL